MIFVTSTDDDGALCEPPALFLPLARDSSNYKLAILANEAWWTVISWKRDRHLQLRKILQGRPRWALPRGRARLGREKGTPFLAAKG